DRDVPDVAAAARARDIEAVVDHLRLESVTLLIWSLNSPAGIIYAATHPERVSRLVCYAAFARYIMAPGRDALGRAFVDLIRAEWGLGSRTIVDFIAPGADKETTDAISTYQKQAASPETAAAIMEESLFRIDVREYLPRLTMPAVVAHRREDPRRASPSRRHRDQAHRRRHHGLVRVGFGRHRVRHRRAEGHRRSQRGQARRPHPGAHRSQCGRAGRGRSGPLRQRRAGGGA